MRAKTILELTNKPKKTLFIEKPDFAKTFKFFGKTIFFAIGDATEKKLDPLVDFRKQKLVKGEMDCGNKHCTYCYKRRTRNVKK